MNNSGELLNEKRKLAEIEAFVEILEYGQDFKEVKIVGDWAFEWGLFFGKSRPLGGEIVRAKAKLFRVLRRDEEGDWKCARSIFHVDEMEKQ